MSRQNRVDRAAYARRRRALDRLAKRHTRARVDAYLISKPEDVSYLSGFTGEDSALLTGNGWSVLVTDFRFAEQAPSECPGSEIRLRANRRSLADELVALINERGVRSVGVQGDHMTIGQERALAKKLRKKRLRPLADLMVELRSVKDDEEVRLTKKAVRIAEAAFRRLIAKGAKHLIGKTERQIAAEMEWSMRSLGADGPAFDMIVATGANGSMCHYRPADRKIKRGDPVLFDWGASIDGYRSDITRVVFTGEPKPKMREIYNIVLRAHDAAVAAVRPGASCGSVDAAARKLIADAGYGNEFGHGIGHGIGREIHESPHVSPGNKQRLRKNSIITIEPGIYLPGVGGVRIEDDILVTTGGRERLNSLPRALAKMILR